MFQKFTFFVAVATVFFTAHKVANAQCSCSGQYVLTGGSNSLNIASGQTYCLVSGTFTGNLDIAAGGKICVSPGANLQPGNMNNFAGTIENRGTFRPQYGINLSAGASIDNYGTVVFNSNLNFNGASTITNRTSGVLQLNTAFQLAGNSTLNNSGVVYSYSGDFNTQTGTTLANTGELRIYGGNFNMAGTMSNAGMFYSANAINLNNGANVTNSCRFVAVKGLINNGTFNNSGLVWATSATEWEARIMNNGGAIWNNTATGQLRGIAFGNDGTVNGSGSFYFTGSTSTQGTFTGSAAAPIQFFDNSRTASQIFDVQNGIVSNTVRPTSMTPGDTTTWGTCTNSNYQTVYNQHTSLPLSSQPLPVSLNGFNGNADAQNNVWLNWNTASEKNLARFEIERSSNGRDFSRIATVQATGINSTEAQRYNYLDDNSTAMSQRYYRLKMVDANGEFTYSNVLVFRSTISAVSLSAAPNPFAGDVRISIANAQPGTASLALIDAMGRVAIAYDVQLTEGANTFAVQGADALTAGTYLLRLAQSGQPVGQPIRLQKR